MKYLTLVRHAKSSWSDPTLSDFDRPLNARGRRNAPEMGQRLRKLGVSPDVIISSPALRARSTVELIARELDLDEQLIHLDEELYHADVTDLTEIIHTLDERWCHVFLCGHNPGFTDLANCLSSDSFDNIPTCGVLSLELSVDSWRKVSQGQATILLYDYPKKISQTRK